MAKVRRCGPNAISATNGSVTAAVEQVTAFGGIDILVNNAGIEAEGIVADNPDDEWIRLLDVNVGIARVTRAASPRLRRFSTASIVNTSSVVANVGVRNRDALPLARPTRRGFLG
jgi:2-keto-3-deoxy-L-fuconate dehydrogenase